MGKITVTIGEIINELNEACKGLEVVGTYRDAMDAIEPLVSKIRSKYGMYRTMGCNDCWVWINRRKDEGVEVIEVEWERVLEPLRHERDFEGNGVHKNPKYKISDTFNIGFKEADTVLGVINKSKRDRLHRAIGQLAWLAREKKKELQNINKKITKAKAALSKI